MPFTKEQQRYHYLKNQELLKARRRKRYLASKSQVEQKVEQINLAKVEQSLVKNVQPAWVEQNSPIEVEQIVQPIVEKPEEINVQPKTAKEVGTIDKNVQPIQVEQNLQPKSEIVVDMDIEAHNQEVYKRAGTKDPQRFFTFPNGQKIVRTRCGCNPTQDFYDWCLDSCQYFTS